MRWYYIIYAHMIWQDMTWYMIYDTRYDMKYDIIHNIYDIWCDLRYIIYDIIWHGMIWHDKWYDKVHVMIWGDM